MLFRSVIIKGIATAEDARIAVDHGVDAVYVSNHGGRQLDQGVGSIEVLPEVVEAVGGRAEVFVDGGFRRGTDVVKAIALGARACLIGRPYMYGLGAGGEAGVDRVLAIFGSELERAMALLGCATIADIDPSMVDRARQRAASALDA